MNVVTAISQREDGKRTRWDYTIALKRLKCHDFDEYRGILPSTEGPDFNPEPPVFACTFCTTPQYEHLLALANEDGKIAIQNTNLRSDHNPFEGHQAHRNAIFDIAWAPSEMKIVSASGDHTAVLWDVLESGQLQEVARFHAHTRSVKNVTFSQQDKTIFASGARDGMIMLWDTRTQGNQLSIRPDNFISNSHCAPGTPGSLSGSRNRRAKPAPSRASSITGLVFQDSHTLMSCGAGDGKIKVWDIRKSYSTFRREPQPKFSLLTPNGSGRSGFTCLALDPGGFKLYASCMDNTIYCYNVATYEEQPVQFFKGHKNSTFYVKACLSPDGRYLLSGSSDAFAYIWDTSISQGENNPIVKLVGHGAEVTSVAWCPVGEVKIATCSDDARHCLWRVGNEFLGDNHQVELHGWAEEISDRPAKAVPSSPRTPATPSFTSWRRWTPCIQRTPDAEIGLANLACEACHQLSTPCMRCIAVRAPVPLSAPQGSKKRLEVLWEEDSCCPECERESRLVLNQVTNNADAPARRLFSPTKRQAPNGTETASGSLPEEIPAKKLFINHLSPLKRHVPMASCASSPKKVCMTAETVSLRRTSPRKRCQISPTNTPEKKFKGDEDGIAGSSKHIDQSLPPTNFTKTYNSLSTSELSPRKSMRSVPAGDQCNELSSSSPVKRAVTPAKRRISDRPTDSPHKRRPPNDDLQGISKIDDSLPANSIAQNRQKSLCARHRRMGFSSPTLNLPNYVVDGTSPHHRCSPVNQHKENVDWLTRLRRERSSTEKRQESDGITEQDQHPPPINSRRAANLAMPGKSSSKVTPAKSSASRITPAKSSSKRTTPAKTSSSRTTPAKPTSALSTPTTPSQAGRKTPARRSSNTDAVCHANNSGETSLLRFFRVSEKPIEQQCSSVNSSSRTSSPVVS